jgi:hypothetical protein
MANSRDEQVDPMSPTTELGLLPKKWKNGKRHDTNNDTLEDFNQLANDGW